MVELWIGSVIRVATPSSLAFTKGHPLIVGMTKFLSCTEGTPALLRVAHPTIEDGRPVSGRSFCTSYPTSGSPRSRIRFVPSACAVAGPQELGSWASLTPVGHEVLWLHEWALWTGSGNSFSLIVLTINRSIAAAASCLILRSRYSCRLRGRFPNLFPSPPHCYAWLTNPFYGHQVKCKGNLYTGSASSFYFIVRPKWTVCNLSHSSSTSILSRNKNLLVQYVCYSTGWKIKHFVFILFIL
jgi:hypothetical protein